MKFFVIKSVSISRTSFILKLFSLFSISSLSSLCFPQVLFGTNTGEKWRKRKDDLIEYQLNRTFEFSFGKSFISDCLSICYPSPDYIAKKWSKKGLNLSRVKRKSLKNFPFGLLLMDWRNWTALRKNYWEIMKSASINDSESIENFVFILN